MFIRPKENGNYNYQPKSDEIRIMHTRSIPEEIVSGSETEEVAENLII